MLELLTVAFITLKAIGVIDWPWIVVLSPGILLIVLCAISAWQAFQTNRLIRKMLTDGHVRWSTKYWMKDWRNKP